MKKISALLLLALVCGRAQGYDNLVILGPGDATPVRGAGTDAAFDSIPGINRLMATLKARGFTGIIDRVDLHDFDYDRFIHPNPMGDDNPEHRFLHKCMQDVTDRFSQGVEARRAAERHGLEFWIWLPIVYSVGCPPAVDELGLDRTNWGYEHTYSLKHRDQLVVDRDGKTQYGVLEYAYPGVRSNMIEEIISFVQKTGARNVIPCLRSETSQMMPPPRHADQYGFNPPVVEEMKRRYHVNILEDPRFDYTHPDFDLHDPMLENWRSLRGSYLTEFYRQLRAALDQIDPGIKVGVQLPGGDYIGPPLGNMRIEWKTWIEERLVDLVILNIPLEATLDPDAPRKGYLTNAVTQKGVHPVGVWRAFIEQSAHPDVRLIQASGNHLFFRPPDSGYDGWRTDFWHLSYNSAWPQRWEQWRRDLREFGHIKYLVENFDRMPPRNICYQGGWGDTRHDPELRKSPGFWMWIGDGSDEKPFAQQAVRQGDSGCAMKLTSANSAQRYLYAKRWVGTDRNSYTFAIDTALYSGTFTLEFHVYRPDRNSSLTVALMDRRLFKIDEIGLQISPGGDIACFDDGQIVSANITADVGAWQRFTLNADLNTRTYSASVDGRPICRSARIKPADPNCPVYSQILFDPGNLPGTEVYLDNVAWHWTPELYDPPGRESVLFSDDFEDAPPETTFKDTLSDSWKIQGQKGFFVENDTSYGLGVNCLRALGGGELSTSVSAKKARHIVLDLNVFIRSDRPGYVYITPPADGLRSENGAQIALTDTSGSPVASVRAAPSRTWYILNDGRYVPTTAAVQYDIWQTVRLVLDRKNRSCAFIVQPIGELPRLIVRQPSPVPIPDQLHLRISPSDNKNHNTCYDNIRLIAYE